MKSERSIRGLACRWSAVVGLALLCSLLSASVAQAQVQTFFVLIPGELQPDERAAYDECAERLSAALVNTDAWRATADIETQRTVQNCVGELASPAADRECKLSMANITVDWVLKLNSRQIGMEWKWGVKALSPDQAGDQMWGGDEIPSGVTDRTRAAYDACDSLARQFACDQGVSSACVGSSFGAGPILGAEAAAPAQGSGPVRAQPALAKISALEVIGPTPPVVSVWIDGREAGTSANQVTGIPPGNHEVALKATGYFDHVEQLAFAADVPTVLQGVRLRKTTATLRVSMLAPAVAAIFIGGRERGSTDRPLAGIAPGEVEVVLRADEYQERREQVTLEADKETALGPIRLEPLLATLTVTANILGAEIVLDGTVVGATTGGPDAFEVAPTAKLLEVRRSGYAPFAQRLSLRAGGAAEVRAELSRVQAAPAAPAAGASSGATGGCPAGYVRIAPGTFMMGSPTGDEGRFDDENQHRVTITRAYCMKATEVTQGEWQSVMGSNPSYFTNCGGNCPVERVSWEEAVGYANALSRREGLPECYAGSSFAGLDCAGYRLPTEAEWEFAVRAGTTGSRYGNLDSVAWYDENSGSATHPVGQKQPNAWGLYDMLGNVWEWTGDWYVAAYPGTLTDPLGAGTGSNRVFRGGSLSSVARGARAAVRDDDAPGYRFGILGFRLSRTASSGSESVKLGSSAATESSSLGGAEGCPAGYVRIAAGAFTMGSPSGEEGRDDDETQQRVTISRGYCMKSTEVTQGEWQALMWSNPSVFKNCGANCPVERVSWEDAVDFANALSRRERLPECYEGSTFTGTDCRGYRLPTEVEWEYAARAGTMGVAYGTLDSVAWYDQNAGGTTHEVRKKQPNAWGLYDMLGNVWEWTGDWYTAQTAASSAPTGESGGSLRVFRGGSWSDGARYARAANRDSDSADDRYSGLGFRLVRTMP